MFVSTPRDWGNVVRDRRNQLGITQEDLAGRVGRARQWVVRFEAGYAGSASLDNLMKIIDALELYVEVNATDEPDALFDHDEDGPLFVDVDISDSYDK